MVVPLTKNLITTWVVGGGFKVKVINPGSDFLNLRVPEIHLHRFILML